MFINCPRGQRNYFVNQPRGKMIVGTLCQLSSRYSCLHEQAEGGKAVLDRRSLFSHGLLEGSRGSYPSNTISLYCFVSTCVEARSFAFSFLQFPFFSVP